jgi:hypothetical protein
VSVPLWAAELAAAFWVEVGAPEPFPRGLSRPIARALPLAVVLLPQLRLAAVRAWLERCAIACPCAAVDRPLRACLVARGGAGLIFLDGADPADERRFSLAHELTHFLRDYWRLRRRACARLGDRVAEVLDGRRPPTPEERLSALLTEVPLRACVHLMERDVAGRFATPVVAAAEDAADRLAYELLAPAASVLAEWVGERAALVPCLQQVYGLPLAQALAYREILLPSAPQPDPLLHRLRRAPS